jgi:BioD-like phosphotransacetylase family protein
MSILAVVSRASGAGRSTVAAALAYRFARDGRRVSLARLAGDDSAEHDAEAFAALDPPLGGGKPITAADLDALNAMGDVIVEARPGAASDLTGAGGVRFIVVENDHDSDPPDLPADATLGTIIIGVPAEAVSSLGARSGVLAVLPEDRTLAAPSVRDIAAALKSRWLVEGHSGGAIARIMIGTVASDAASPYFAARERKCVVTRYDKTDIQLAALGTDLELLLLTGGGQPSPYLLDRVAGERNGVSVLVAEEDTVDAMRVIEGLYGRSRFEGQAKLERAVALLDEAGVNIAP